MHEATKEDGENSDGTYVSKLVGHACQISVQLQVHHNLIG